MANVQLTHKLRNPKSYNDWMNIWTAHAESDIYTIYPSSNWKIPINQLTTNSVTEENGSQTISTSSSIGSNTLTKTDNNGNLVAGPIINNNGDETTFLNEKGEWVEIPQNTDSTAGIVAAGNSKGTPSNVWLTDSTDNPDWGKVTVDHLADNLDLSSKLKNNSIPGDKLKDNSVSGSKLNTKLLGVLIDTDKPVSANSASLAEELKRTDYKLNHNDQEPNWWIDNNWDWNHLGIWVEI